MMVMQTKSKGGLKKRASGPYLATLLFLWAGNLVDLKVDTIENRSGVDAHFTFPRREMNLADGEYHRLNVMGMFYLE